MAIATSLKVKKRLMYIVFALIFVFGGMEYAVILPTLWLYLSTKYEAPEYMLGLVLSAYSLAALFSAPVIGRLSDRLGCSKQIFIVCASFELVGSFLYFIQVSEWLCLGSRFVSGLGAASEAVAIAEVSRYTSEKERTAIISYLVAMRQIALLIGPGLNAFLRLADFKIGPFEVSKFTAPGGLMVIVWAVLIMIVVAIYTEPKWIFNHELKGIPSRSQEQGESTSEAAETHEERECGSSEKTKANTMGTYTEENFPDTEPVEQSGSSDYKTATQRTVYSSDYDCDFQSSSYNQDDAEDKEKEFLFSGNDSTFEYPPVTFHSRREKEYDDTGSEAYKTADVSRDSRYNSESSTTLLSDYQNIEKSPSREEISYSLSEDRSVEGYFYTSCQLSSSVDLLISAERFIHDAQYSKTFIEKDKAENVDLVFSENHFGEARENIWRRIPSHSLSERPPLLREETPSHSYTERSPLLKGKRKFYHNSSQTSLVRSQGANDPYIERSTSCLNDPIAIEGKLGFFCNEYIRDEIIAIIWLLFCSMFSQICVETMVLPLSLKYLDFNELENSLLYCGCGIEIIIVFVMVSKLSKRFSDRDMMIFGAVILLASNVWLICFLPNSPTHARNHNLPIFAVAVFLDVLSLPFLLVCATSLYSKLTRKQTQGLSQGLRRGVVGLGTVLAPLWGSSAVNQPYLLLGVLLALQGLSLILCVISYQRLRPVPTSSSFSTQTIIISPDRSSRNGSRVDTYSPPYRNSSQNASTFHPTHSASYGSIQVSLAESSLESTEESSEYRPVVT